MTKAGRCKSSKRGFNYSHPTYNPTDRSLLTWPITIAIRLITLLVPNHEPPSKQGWDRVSCFQPGHCRICGNAHLMLGQGCKHYIKGNYRWGV